MLAVPLLALLATSCFSRELNHVSWPAGPGFSRTAYRIPLQGSAVRSETRPCVRACKARRTTDGYFACVAACPYVRVRPGPCRPGERPPWFLCVEHIREAGGRGTDATDLAELMVRFGAPAGD
jgi:hypothetical protein